MNCTEIKNLAVLHSGLNDIPNTYVIMYINKAMDELVMQYDEAGKKGTTTINVTDTQEWYDLPQNCLSIKRVHWKDFSSDFNQFIVENNQIKFIAAGEYKIEYIMPNDHVTAMTDTPEINFAFHNAISYSVAYEETCRVFMHEDSNRNELLLRYNAEAEKARIKLNLKKRSRKTANTVPFV